MRRRMSAKKTTRRPGPVGTNIKRLRDERGWSQQRLADEADKRGRAVHPITISKLETGVSQDADLTTLRTLASALEVHVSDLTGTTIEAPTPLVEEYEHSPWASIDKPTEEELNWLRSKAGIVFGHGAAPSAEAVHHLLMVHRSK